MAYEAQAQQDDDKKNNQAGQASSGGMLTFGASPQPDAGASAKQERSGSWANLQSYLDANQDQAKQMGEKVAGGITGDIEGAKQSFESAQKEFDQAPAINLEKEKGTIDQVLKDPAKASDQDVSHFQDLTKGTYGGPKSIQDTSGWATAAANANKAQTSTDLSKSEEGRQTLLSREYARPDYSQGAKTLDQMLIQRSPDAQKAIQDSAQKWGAINQAIGAAPGSTAALGAQRTQAAADAAEYAKKQAGEKVSGLTGSIDDRVKTLNQDRDTAWKNVSGDVTDDQWSDYTLGQLGLQAGQKLYDLDIGKYLGQAPEASRANVATADEYAKYLALSKLMGSDPTYLTAATQAQAGTAKPGVVFDRDRFLADVKAKEGDYQTAYSQADNNFKAINEKLQAVQAQVGNLQRGGVSVPQDLLAQMQGLQSQFQKTKEERDGLAAIFNANRTVNAPITGTTHQVGESGIESGIGIPQPTGGVLRRRY